MVLDPIYGRGGSTLSRIHLHTSTPPSPVYQVEERRVSGVHKGTVVRGETDCPLGALHITDCHDTVIYALAPLQVE